MKDTSNLPASRDVEQAKEAFIAPNGDLPNPALRWPDGEGFVRSGPKMTFTQSVARRHEDPEATS